MTPLRKPTADLPFTARGERKTSRTVELVGGEGQSHESPARALQQRLEQAALQSFYAVAEPEEQVMRWEGAKRIAIIVAAAVGTWVLLFGLGRSLLA